MSFQKESYDDEDSFVDSLNERACPLVYPTTDEARELRDFMKKTFPERYAADILYHFTKPVVVVKLLEKDSDFRCTFYGNTNDSNEWQQGIVCVSKHLRKKGELGLAAKVDALPEKKGCPPWICCFSQNDDTPPMWGMYGGGRDGGYAVGFSRAELERLVDEKNRQEGDEYFLLPCLYEPTDFGKMIDYILCEHHVDEDERTCREGCEGELESRILSRLFFLTLILKHPSFAYENEWRLVVRKRDVTYPFVNMDGVQWTGAPFIPSGLFKELLRNYVRRIVVSSCGEEYVKEENYNRILTKKEELKLGYEIIQSRSPYNGK